MIRTAKPQALALGAIDEVGADPAATVTFIATPAGAVAEAAAKVLEAGGVVTDVAGIKGPIVAQVDHPRFVGGHPMAGSEQAGVEGSDPDMFEGATWVLTPAANTDPRAFATVRSAVSALGANVVELPAGPPRRPGRHGVPRSAPDGRHPDEPGGRRRPGARHACCAWRPADSGI